jgi:DNA repair protein RAD5
VKARSGVRRVELAIRDKHSPPTNNNTTTTTMEAPHPDERPAKKRRFFTEDSSPVQIRTKQPSEHAPPPSPPPTVGSHEEAQPAAEAPAENPSVDSEGFDVGMLEAVVGELSISTIKQLKDVSGNNVERGRR